MRAASMAVIFTCGGIAGRETKEKGRAELSAFFSLVFC
jgi:hypothetical protein